MAQLSTSITIGGFPAIIADEATLSGTLAHRKASSIFCPLGPAPSRAWFLLTKRDLDSLTAGTGAKSPQTIVWTQTLDTNTTTRNFTGFYFANSTRVLHGGVGDKNALHLVEFTDARGIVAKMSDTDSLNANIRSYAQATDYLDTTEGYTWTSLLTELWNLCPGLGAFPDLPAGFTPDGVPQNTRFIGVSAWHALCAVLDKLDCAVAHNPLAAAGSNYSIVRLGATQIQAEPTGNLLKWSAEPKDFPATDIPATVRTYFHNHYKSYGQERDTELTTNWSVVGAGAYVDVATGDASAIAGTVVPLWDDLPRVLDEYNVIENASDVNTRATARKDGFLQRQRTTREHKIYIGVQAFQCGGQVRAVLWRNWGDYDADFGGTVTEYIQRPELVMDYQPGAGGGGGGGVMSPATSFITSKAHENYQPVDLARHTFPSYPRLPNIVQVYHSGGSAGQTVSANTDGFHPGRVRRWVANTMAVLEDCWILFVDDFDNNGGDVDAIDGDYFGPARLSGVSTSGGTLKPVYTVRRGAANPLVRFELTENLTLGGEADAEFLVWNGAAYVTTGVTLTVKDFTDTPGSWIGATGFQGWATLPPDNDTGKYEIVWMETFARFIEFTSTEDMGATNANQMSVTVNAWWDIKEPTASPVIVHDPRALFTRALSGAKGKAVYNPKIDAYEAVECQSKAGWIRGTLNADMSGGSSAAAVVSDYGGSQQDVQNPGASATVYDPQDLFKRALNGAKFKAIYDAVDDKYLLVECQSKAGWLWVTLTSDMSSSATCTVGGYKGSQQDTQNPGTISVYPITGISDSLKSGDTVLAFYDNVGDKYYAIAKPYTPMWGYTQAAWVANGGDAYVSIKLVTGTPPRTSSTVSGSAFNCYLPRVNDRDPNVVASKNICFMYDNNGDAVALSDYMDAKIGSVMFMAKNMTEPTGWGFMDSSANSSGNGGTGIDARRRFIRTPATVAEAGALGGDGNATSSYKHNHALSCLTAFGDGGVVTSPSVVEFWAFQGSATTGDPDGTAGAISGQPGGRNFSFNEDPMYVHLPAIERLDNKSA